MSRRGSSSRWYQTQISDPFVKERERQGLRSRAAFKLTELIARDRLLRPSGVVLDLGAAPGGWSQIAAPLVGAAGLVVAVDLLPMTGLAGVQFILGDCRDPETLVRIGVALQGRPVDLVLSDMAPNLSGIRAVDEARSVELAETAWEAAQVFLKVGGSLVLKMFQHQDSERFLLEIRKRFSRMNRRKPAASRSGSREFYVVAGGLKG
ncbi:MAG: RlmE family RNA methyltransferase [Gammaproteobacteria bacterium]|nr:RlmE family RNA methyltransferase [Gammaproteobacteria bacterium]